MNMQMNVRRIFGVVAMAVLLLSWLAGIGARAEETVLPSGYPYVYGDGEPYSTRVNLGGASFIHKFGVCRFVANGSTLGDLFVPLNTSGEWKAFRESNPDGSTLDPCCGYQQVTYCGETKTIGTVWVLGAQTTMNFGYSANVTYSCSPTGDATDGTGIWSAILVSGDCDAPPPPEETGGGGGGNNEPNDHSDPGNDNEGGDNGAGNGGDTGDGY